MSSNTDKLLTYWKWRLWNPQSFHLWASHLTQSANSLYVFLHSSHLQSSWLLLKTGFGTVDYQSNALGFLSESGLCKSKAFWISRLFDSAMIFRRVCDTLYFTFSVLENSACRLLWFVLESLMWWCCEKTGGMGNK